jgi:hypothetical protein
MGLDDERPDVSPACDELWANEVAQEVRLTEEGVIAASQLVWHMEADRPRLLELVAQVVPQRDQVDVVVGVHVADEDRTHAGRLASRGQPSERALTEVQHDGVVAKFHEVGR